MLLNITSPHSEILSSNLRVELDSTGTSRWSPYPPYRSFGMSPCSRSHDFILTRFGIQSRKKGQAQLGIYLHLQSYVDSIPAASILSQPQGAKDGVLDFINVIAHPPNLLLLQRRFTFHPSLRSSSPFTHSTRPDSPSLPSTSAFNLRPISSTLMTTPHATTAISWSRYQRISPSVVQVQWAPLKHASAARLMSLLSRTWGWKFKPRNWLPATNIIRRD